MYNVKFGGTSFKPNSDVVIESPYFAKDVEPHIGSDSSLMICTIFHKSLVIMHYGNRKQVKNTRPSHHDKHDDTHATPNNYSRAGKISFIRHSVWLDMSLKRALSVEFVEKIKHVNSSQKCV
jgi:hypothetical protein